MEFLDPFLDSSLFPILVIYFLMAGAVFFYVQDKFSIELISISLLTFLLLFGELSPPLQNGQELSAKTLLSGFANPMLLSLMALLVMGQALFQTNALRPIVQLFNVQGRLKGSFSILFIILLVMVLSGFMNNTPLVVLAIPIIQALTYKAGTSDSRFLMPLSFIAILGGMTTLVGSSTNLLVSSALQEIGMDGLGFFSFTIPGLFLAGAGLVYALFILPLLMPVRKKMTDNFRQGEREFILEIDVDKESRLIGEEYKGDHFPSLKMVTARLIQRKGQIILPPFSGAAIEAGDIIIVAAKKDDITNLLAKYPGFMLKEEQDKEREEDDHDRRKTRLLCEVMIPPASRLVDMTLPQTGFKERFNAQILGIQRRAKVIRRRLSRVRLEPGDVLLVAGTRSSLDAMREGAAVVVLSGTKQIIPHSKKAPLAISIFFGVIGLAALEILPISVAAISGAVALILTNCINIQQATRALDRKIFFLVGSMLALGQALQITGGADLIAQGIDDIPHGDSSLIMAIILFGIVAFMTNILTNNATAILFTPIAVNLANILGEDPMTFALTVLFAANCSFASPIGYQTNLLVMGPGHYEFKDFIRFGLPLVIILWIAYGFVAHFYFGLR